MTRNDSDLKYRIAGIIQKDAGGHDCTQVAYKILEAVDESLTQHISDEALSGVKDFKKHLLNELRHLPATEISRSQRENDLLESLDVLLSNYYALGKASHNLPKYERIL